VEIKSRTVGTSHASADRYYGILKAVGEMLLELGKGICDVELQGAGKNDYLEILTGSINLLKREFGIRNQIERTSFSTEGITKSTTDKLGIRQSDAEKIIKVREYLISRVEKRLGPPQSLQDIAYTFALNEFKLKRYFKLLYNTSVFRFFREECLKRAAHLLITTEKSIKEISIETYFSSSSHFSAAFRQKYRCKPSTFRKLMRNKMGT